MGTVNEMIEVSEAFYQRSGPEVRTKIQELFNCIDENKDGKISRGELKKYLESKTTGYEAILRKFNVFSLLDQNREGYLLYDQIVTLYYLIESERPVCDYCENFIPGAYFICSQCYREEQNYNLCIVCYNRGEFQNEHDHSLFECNYTIVKKREKSQRKTEINGEVKRRALCVWSTWMGIGVCVFSIENNLAQDLDGSLNASSSQFTGETRNPKWKARVGKLLKKGFNGAAKIAAIGSFIAELIC